jgi:hypothetical protein
MAESYVIVGAEEQRSGGAEVLPFSSAPPLLCSSAGTIKLAAD